MGSLAVGETRWRAARALLPWANKGSAKLTCVNDAAELFGLGLSRLGGSRMRGRLMARAIHGDQTVCRPPFAASPARSFEPLDERCATCGARLKLVGFMPHEHDPNLRREFYRCRSCGRKSDRSVRADW